DVADAVDHPLDAAIAARLVLFIVNRGEQYVLGADLVGGVVVVDADRPHFETDGVRVEVAEITVAPGLGVCLDDVAEGEEVMREIGGIVRDALAAAASAD